MTRIFDALKKAESAREPARPGAAAMPAFAAVRAGDPGAAGRGSMPMLGAVPLDDDVLKQMSALRVTLDATLRERAPRVVAFLGAQGGEGASTIAMQFAQTLARDPGARPLLVDCHCARPALQVDPDRRCAVLGPQVLGPASELGSVVTANLFVLPLAAGQQQERILQPATLRQALELNTPGFDWVVLDCPAVLEAPEATALAAVADGAVLVLQAGRSKRPILTRALELLSKGGARLMGTVLNRRVHEIPEFIYRRI